MADGAKDRLVEIALKSIRPEKFDRQSGRPNERPKNPAQLAAKKQIAHEPGTEHFARDTVAATQGPQQTKQPQVRRYASEGDDDDLRELHKIVSRPGNLRLPGERRCVPDNEKGDGRERTEDCRRDREAHQHEHKRLPKPEVESEQWREHAVDERIAEGGSENDEREFEEVVAGLNWRSPVAHRRAIQPRACEDHQGVSAQSGCFPTRRPIFECVWTAAEQYRNLSNLKIGSGGAHRNADGQTEASERNVVIDCSSAGQARRLPPAWPSVSRPGPALL